MATRSRPFFVRYAGAWVRLLVRWVARAWARLERQVADDVLKTTTRRRLSRIAGIVLFGCMTVAVMGGFGCGSCDDSITLLLGADAESLAEVLGLVDSSDYLRTIHAHPMFTGTDGSHTGIASFQGNFTAVAQPSGSCFFLLRGANCSLSQITGTSALNGTANGTAATPNYEPTSAACFMVRATGRLRRCRGRDTWCRRT
jgi:hypothetical protein